MLSKDDVLENVSMLCGLHTVMVNAADRVNETLRWIMTNNGGDYRQETRMHWNRMLALSAKLHSESNDWADNVRKCIVTTSGKEDPVSVTYAEIKDANDVAMLMSLVYEATYNNEDLMAELIGMIRKFRDDHSSKMFADTIMDKYRMNDAGYIRKEEELQ